VKRDLSDVYVCPVTRSRLSCEGAVDEGGEVDHCELVSEFSQRYAVRGGVPVFLPEKMLSAAERQTQAAYDASADQKYDDAIDWQFRSFYEDEDEVREKMIRLLDLRPDSRVLEIGSGTGRDSFRIARKLGERGEFFVQDLSEQMVLKARDRLDAARDKLGLNARIECFVSTARVLPFPDGFFDSVFHFGGFNDFSEPKKTLAEMTRVVKTNGRVVFGDESLPPWLSGTEFGEIITTNNPLFRNKVPLDCLPEGARDVTVRWIFGSCFYLIDFRVGDGPPPVDIDLPHKGWRGGSMRTRYYGRLEGVTPEVRKMAIAAARTRGVSVHKWLDDLVRAAAEAELTPSDDVEKG
jgi:ubiquinone/menaquinone biosynthesis C-methylase UbiE